MKLRIHLILFFCVWSTSVAVVSRKIIEEAALLYNFNSPILISSMTACDRPLTPSF